MAKISFSKLGLKLNQDIKSFEFQGQNIEVKQYLPINEKLKLISNVINSAADENNFPNSVKLSMFLLIEIIFTYTNINFTDKQKEDICKLYDVLESNGLFSTVIEYIPKEEYEMIEQGVINCANAIYNYKTSVLGILDTVSTDYSNLKLDASEIQKNLADPNNLGFLKEVLTKLG